LGFAVPTPINFTMGDPFDYELRVQTVTTASDRANESMEVPDYCRRGHHSIDTSLTDEYDTAAFAQIWERVLKFGSGQEGGPL
jgi:hypothetical protein